jgi:hypothetical protein
MTTSKLLLYNNALLHLGERQLASLAEDREPRRVLDSIWDGGAIDHCLSQGYWRFATRTQMLDYDVTTTPTFGYRRAFAQPSDMVRLAKISVDEYFNLPLTEYVDERRFWFCDYDLLYVAFISNDTAYGGDYAKWTPTFTLWVEQYLASRTAMRIKGDAKLADYHRSLSDKLLRDAKAKDAMGDPSKLPPPGTWSSARGAGVYKRDRGSRQSLTG